MQAPGSILATNDHHIHRSRRATLNHYFSQQMVRKLEPIINDTLANLLRRMEGWAREGKPKRLNTPIRAATADVIEAYAFGNRAKCLDMPDCNAGLFEILTPQRVNYLGAHVFWLARIMANLPPPLMIRIVPRVGVFARFMQVYTVPIPKET
jgi:hypothetical protein